MPHSFATNRKNGQRNTGVVGIFIRQRRETIGLSQRALGQLFEPPVTTQFISNIERGMTPLPPTHIATLVRALQVDEGDLKALLEREYTLRLSERLGQAPPDTEPEPHAVFFKALYEAYMTADESKRAAFHEACENFLKVSRR